MSPTNEGRETWRAEPETSSASGGHLSPDPAERTMPLAAGAERGGDEDRPRPVASTRRRFGVRRVRRTVRRIDPLSVLKLSLFFYTIFLGVWLLFVAIAYSLLENAGLFDLIESVREGFALGGQFDITLGQVEMYSFVIGLTLMVIGALVNVLLALLYNLAADLIGGLEITFSERDV